MKKELTSDRKIKREFIWIVLIVCVFTILVYLWFAVYPESCEDRFPTGGWDWLAYLGTVSSVLITGYGIITTIVGEAEITRQQVALSARPYFNATVFTHYKYKAKDCLNGVCIPVLIAENETGGYMALDGELYNVQDYYNISGNSKKESLRIHLDNIGLGAAIQVHITIHNVVNFDKQSEGMHKSGVVNFYDEFRYYYKENHRAFYDGANKKNCIIQGTHYFEFSEFHLGKDCGYDIVFPLMTNDNMHGNANMVARISFSDAYNQNKYVQFLFFSLGGNGQYYYNVSHISKYDPII